MRAALSFRKRVEVGWQGNPDDISELIEKLAEIEWAIEALVPDQVGVLACSL